MTVGFDTCGYDGQFYYAIARAPWQNARSSQRRRRDPASTDLVSGDLLVLERRRRSQRASVGHAAGEPSGNRGAGLDCAAWAVHQGWNAWWGCLLPLAVNAGLAALRDLTDPVAILSVCGLLFAWLTHKRWWILTVWAAAALFAREQSVVIVLIIFSLGLWHGRFRTVVALAAVTALLVRVDFHASADVRRVAFPTLRGKHRSAFRRHGVSMDASGILDLQAGRQCLHVLRMLHLTAAAWSRRAVDSPGRRSGGRPDRAGRRGSGRDRRHFALHRRMELYARVRVDAVGYLVWISPGPPALALGVLVAGVVLAAGRGDSRVVARGWS